MAPMYHPLHTLDLYVESDEDGLCTHVQISRQVTIKGELKASKLSMMRFFLGFGQQQYAVIIVLIQRRMEPSIL